MRGLSSRSLLAVLFLAPAAAADDWPQWMGPNRDGVWKETGILEKFPEGGPKKLWPCRSAAGTPARPSPAARCTSPTGPWPPGTEGRPDPFDARPPIPGTERVLCLDAKTGKEVWKHEYKCRYQVSTPTGPRCTPTVSGGKVYTLGAMGDLSAWTRRRARPSGRRTSREYKAEMPLWGFCGHPLVYKNLLICLVGGDGRALAVAFDKDTGKEVWKALTPAEPKEPGTPRRS